MMILQLHEYDLQRRRERRMYGQAVTNTPGPIISYVQYILKPLGLTDFNLCKFWN